MQNEDDETHTSASMDTLSQVDFEDSKEYEI